MNTINFEAIENAMTEAGWDYNKAMECWFHPDSATHCAYIDTIGDDCTGISLENLATRQEKSYDVGDLRLGAMMSEDRAPAELVGFVTYYATGGAL